MNEAWMIGLSRIGAIADADVIFLSHKLDALEYISMIISDGIKLLN